MAKALQGHGLASAHQPAPEEWVEPASDREPWGLFEVFILIQFLSPALLMFPGMQVLRMPIRVLPYAFSIFVFMVLFQRRGSSPVPRAQAPGSGWMVLVLALLCVNLFHPTTILKSGLAQLAFQLTILGPVFWVMFVPVTTRRLNRILWLCLICNGLSALVGALQVYMPLVFLPSEFSSNLSQSYLGSLSFEGAHGRLVVRPPGLSDVPGGAARGAVFSSFLALFFATEKRQGLIWRILLVVVLLVSFFTLYLTQVRSKFLILVGAAAVLAFLRIRRGEGMKGLGVVLLVVASVTLSFSMAVQVGGEEVSSRYMDMADTGIIESYRKNRGIFLGYTFNHVVWDYPLGAGAGRWGMMNSYFGRGNHVPSLWAEIQLTGWIYDGGIPMLVLYVGALTELVTGKRRWVYPVTRELHFPEKTFAHRVCCVFPMVKSNFIDFPEF